MNNTLKLLTIPAFLGAAVGANAATLSDLANFSFTGGFQDLSLTQFDPSLGTLTKVTFTLSGDVSGGNAAADNEGNTSETDITFTFATNVYVATNDVVIASGFTGQNIAESNGNTITAVSPAFDFTADNGDSAVVLDVDVAGNDYNAWSPGFNGEAVSDAGDINSIFWSYIGEGSDKGYVGTGSIVFSVTKADSVQMSGTGSYSTSTSPTQTSGTIEVLYTYDAAPIPEPASYAAIFGLAALGFVATRRRR